MEIKSYYVIMRETVCLAHKSIYEHLTRMAAVEEIIYANVKGTTGGKNVNANACCYCKANAT